MTDKARWGILYCPKNGLLSTPQKRWSRIEKCLKEQGIAYDFVQSEASGSVERLITMLIDNGYKTIVVMGGDSALNDAVNCLMQAKSEVRREIALGVIPNGVMNDFASYWGFKESEPEQTIAWLAKRRTRAIDLGCIHYANARGERCHRYFLNCINIGLVASIMNLRRQTRHVLGSKAASFAASFMLMLFQRMEYQMELVINSEHIKRKMMTVCIGSARGYGQTPNAVPYNGMLDVSVVYHPEVAQLFEGIYLFLKGKFLNHRNVHPYRTKEVKVCEAQRAMVGIDGRLMNTPEGAFTIDIEQEVVNFMIPE